MNETKDDIIKLLIQHNGNCWKAELHCGSCPVPLYGRGRGILGPYNCTSEMVFRLMTELQADQEIDKLLKNNQT